MSKKDVLVVLVVVVVGPLAAEGEEGLARGSNLTICVYVGSWRPLSDTHSFALSSPHFSNQYRQYRPIDNAKMFGFIFFSFLSSFYFFFFFFLLLLSMIFSLFFRETATLWELFTD